ncbi:hypothetical protein QBC38DRAFT_69141 [Podospora fimiseda]|uniref:Alpha-ketoglutarate-dependent dioxygenase AlkB-like domain-containing protein n=1 Tax=Podospora fimiseda TaxID=252190 RepID=A0AAN7H2A7_9PEZI|nr:hypothetical protein QBC38DRAFT_69141 [Podospora fimiseda]
MDSSLTERVDGESSPPSTPPSSLDGGSYLPILDSLVSSQELPIRTLASQSTHNVEPMDGLPRRTSKRAAAIRANANLKLMISNGLIGLTEIRTKNSVPDQEINNDNFSITSTYDESGLVLEPEINNDSFSITRTDDGSGLVLDPESDNEDSHLPKRPRFATEILADQSTAVAHIDSIETVRVEEPAASNVAADAGESRTLKRKRGAKLQDAVVDATEDLRPDPSVRPLVWSNQRGGLCEALPYYRAYKGSLHTSNKLAKGFLIDVEIDQGDFFGQQVIISSVGGGRTRDPTSKSMVRTIDAPDTATNVDSLRNAWVAKSLVVIIAGEKHPLYPCKPPHPYAVLGHFHITKMWKEKQIPKGATREVLIWRVRFQKANLDEPSWWMPEQAPTPVGVATKVRTCQSCGVVSNEIFTTGWFCLNQTCETYYIFTNGQKVQVQGLEYSPEFLNERDQYLGDIPSIIPEMPSGEGFHGTEMALRRGFVCPDCGCCNRRLFWNTWACENKDCNFVQPAPMSPYPTTIWTEEIAKFNAVTEARREKYGVNLNLGQDPLFVMDDAATIFQRGYISKTQALNLGGYTIRQYFLPDSAGKIIGSFSIFSSTSEINAQPGGPDELFRALEVEDIGLRRNPAAIAGHKLEGLTRHFQQNFGARYKFGVSVQSKGFSEAPDAILRALHRLIWAKRVAVPAHNQFLDKVEDKFVGEYTRPTGSQDFNELLALGYMENDCIHYHDDGESELGPVVAALALGSPCLMRFRPKAKTGFQLPVGKDRGKTAYKEVLEVCMRHGDIMVMSGTQIQKLYEHAVQPMGNRRFALTARYIDPDKMQSQSDRDDAALKGSIPAHAEQFAYNGF